MKFVHKFIVPAFACIGLTGCGDLFETSFNWDRPGHAPSMANLGFQDGSQIRPGASQNVFVTSKMGLVQKKALAFVETQTMSQEGNRTFLQSAPVKDANAPVYVSWIGQFGAGGAMKVVLGYLGHPYVEIRFDEGDIIVAGTRQGSYLPGDHHKVAVMLEPAARRYQVEIGGDGKYSSGVLTGSVPAPKGEAGNLVIADFGIESVGQERLVYVLDDVRMSHTARP